MFERRLGVVRGRKCAFRARDASDPRAARLLAAAGLPGELPIGTIGCDADDRRIVAIVRESQRRFLALVRADAADAFWARLLSAGEPLGAAFVGRDALTLLSASSSATR